MERGEWRVERPVALASGLAPSLLPSLPRFLPPSCSYRCVGECHHATVFMFQYMAVDHHQARERHHEPHLQNVFIGVGGIRVSIWQWTIVRPGNGIMNLTYKMYL